MMQKLIPSQIAALIFCALAALPASGSGKASDESSRPLVIASMDYVKPSDKGTVIEKTAESLRKHFPGRSVEVAPVPASEFGKELTAGKLDFFITSAGQSYRLQQDHGVRVFGTLVQPGYPDPNHGDGAAILVRKSDGITDISALRGRTLLANTSIAFTGFYVPMGEVAKVDPNWETFFSSVKFVGGGSHLAEALTDVAEGKAGVAFARLCFFESWAKDHPDLASKLAVVGEKTEPGEPCRRSTPLYSSWIITGTNRLTPGEARSAELAILNMPPDSHGNYWGIATDFLPVDHLYRTLRIGKYRYLRETTVQMLLREYWPLFIIAVLAAIGLILHAWRSDVLVRRRTEQLKALMDEQQKLQKKALDATKHLDALQKMGALGQVSGMLAHEMRQPLSTMSFYLDGLRMLLKRGVIGPAEKLSEPLSQIERQAKKASDIVDHARSYARSSRLEGRRVWIRLGDALKEAAENYRVSRKTPLRLDVSHADADVWVRIDPLELECVVFNLLKNAGEAAEGADSPAVMLNAIPGNGKIRVEVIDNGPTLDDEAFARLSSPLNSTKEGGLGLGISIVRELLSSYGSHLLYERIPGGGLRASFELECVKENPGEGERK